MAKLQKANVSVDSMRKEVGHVDGREWFEPLSDCVVEIVVVGGPFICSWYVNFFKCSFFL